MSSKSLYRQPLINVAHRQASLSTNGNSAHCNGNNAQWVLWRRFRFGLVIPLWYWSAKLVCIEPVSTEMGDHLWTGLTSHPLELSMSIPLDLGVGEISSSESWDINRHMMRYTTNINVSQYMHVCFTFDNKFDLTDRPTEDILLLLIVCSQDVPGVWSEEHGASSRPVWEDGLPWCQRADARREWAESNNKAPIYAG